MIQYSTQVTAVFINSSVVTKHDLDSNVLSTSVRVVCDFSDSFSNQTEPCSGKLSVTAAAYHFQSSTSTAEGFQI